MMHSVDEGDLTAYPLHAPVPRQVQEPSSAVLKQSGSSDELSRVGTLGGIQFVIHDDYDTNTHQLLEYINQATEEELAGRVTPLPRTPSRVSSSASSVSSRVVSLKAKDLTDPVKRFTKVAQGSLTDLIRHPLTLCKLEEMIANENVSSLIRTESFNRRLDAVLKALFEWGVAPRLNQLVVNSIEDRYAGYLEGVESIDLPIDVRSRLVTLAEDYWVKGEDPIFFKRAFYQTILPLDEEKQNHLGKLCERLGEFAPDKFYERREGHLTVVANQIETIRSMLLIELDEQNRFYISKPPQAHPLETRIVYEKTEIGHIIFDTISLGLDQALKSIDASAVVNQWLVENVFPEMTEEGWVNHDEWLAELKGALHFVMPRVKTAVLRLLKPFLDLYLQGQVSGHIEAIVHVLTCHTAAYFKTREELKICPSSDPLTFLERFQKVSRNSHYDVNRYVMPFKSDSSQEQTIERFVKEQILPRFYSIMGKDTLYDVLYNEMLPGCRPYIDKLREQFSGLNHVEKGVFRALGGVLEDKIVAQLVEFLQSFTNPSEFNKHIIKLMEWQRSKIKEKPLQDDYLVQKRKIEESLNRKSITKEKAEYYQAQLALSHFLDYFIKQISLPDIPGIDKWISAALLELFELLQQPEMNMSLLYHLLEKVLFDIDKGYKPTPKEEDIYKTSFQAAKETKDERIDDQALAKISSFMLAWFENCSHLPLDKATWFEKGLVSLSSTILTGFKEKVIDWLNKMLRIELHSILTLNPASSLFQVMFKFHKELRENPDWLEKLLAKPDN